MIVIEKNIDDAMIGPRLYCQYCKKQAVLSPCWQCQYEKKDTLFCCRGCGNCTCEVEHKICKIILGNEKILEGLDDIDWSSLNHAYGEASNVPKLLKSLLSYNAQTCNQIIGELYSCICHQGTVYTASAAAVPFLYELLTIPKVKSKENIVYLLVDIADGYGYLEVHAVGEFGETTWKDILREENKSLEEEMAREAAETNSVRQSISKGLQYLIPFLRSNDPHLRFPLATILGNYPEKAALSLPALESALVLEEDQKIRKAMEESKKHLENQLNLHSSRQTDGCTTFGKEKEDS